MRVNRSSYSSSSNLSLGDVLRLFFSVVIPQAQISQLVTAGASWRGFFGGAHQGTPHS
ncbi:hypothetical protein ACRALDRAFT_2021132 [Sodiomyces alcalophilus JCM 7366]|uniref:uncharacterized protein n=1 Tax=Sodiomyces alcalophilus JCM 7366 TaxID=591952 RepID=UPI0039B404F8